MHSISRNAPPSERPRKMATCTLTMASRKYRKVKKVDIMTFEKNLQERKNDALKLYQLAKADFMATVSKDNIKGDFEKYKVFCDRKADCMRLGVRI